MSNGLNIPIPERETYVPAFTPKHKNESAPVLSRKGEPLGFTIGEVLPERRFAIDTDGRCLDEREFEPMYFKWVSLVCAPDGRIVSLASINKYFDPRLEPVPNPEDFVNARIVGEKIIPITFDETKVEIPRNYEDRRFTAQGELVAAQNKASLADRTALAKVEALNDLVKDGTITVEQFSAKVAQLMGGATVEEAVQATEKPPGFDAALPEPTKGEFVAPCGADDFKYEHNMKAHRKFCQKPECVEYRMSAEAA
jgi:hypothetical protein